ncbi:major capsid protein [Nitrospirillum viridazoti]|uniref:Major capsid protein E n=1 Tax=Nitrospirillum viridazoti CBAmc TaxID=1441467 RepID=A0A248JS89_9PROT|nr:major capsid protein [Nitrospirillum amazonense]ASG21406.1 hypothetical protein Y958_11630 [Nitrospirillum amazonense CBAmc]TWB33084.1 major capsid protein E [Nitrospirillum amazonense]
MSAISMDIFNGDAFKGVTMTKHVNENIPYVPGFLGGLGLFPAEGINTIDAMFDEEGGQLTLIPASPRGSPPSQDQNSKAKRRSLPTVRLAREAVITADELAGVLVPGTTDQLETVERRVYKRVEGPLGLRAQLSYTMEHLYLGAIDGQVIDADGATVLYDFFDFYNVARPDTQTIQFGTFTGDGGLFSTAMRKLKRQIIKELNGFVLAGAYPIALCGDDFFDAAVDNQEVVKSRQVGNVGNAKAPTALSEAAGAYSTYDYGGILWVNYRGSDDGKVSIPQDEARVFMHGVPGLFQCYFGYADTLEFVNTEGLPVYMLQNEERQTSRARVFEVQSNPLPACLRPKSLLRLKKG